MEYLQRGNSQRSAEKVFGVNLTTINGWHQKYQRTGSLENKPRVRKPKKIDPEKLKEYIAAHPDAYLTEIGEAFNCSESANGLKVAITFFSESLPVSAVRVVFLLRGRVPCRVLLYQRWR